MEEHCVFCGAPIPDDAVYCQECEPIVERLKPSQRLVLEKMLADKAARAMFCESWERVKEAVAEVLYCVLHAINSMMAWLNEQEEAEHGGTDV